jgi:hypothetical protein
VLLAEFRAAPQSLLFHSTFGRSGSYQCMSGQLESLCSRVVEL